MFILVIKGDIIFELIDTIGVRKNIVDKKKLFLGLEIVNNPRITPDIVAKLIKPPKKDDTKAPSRLETSIRKINLPLRIAPRERTVIGSKTETGEFLDNKG